MSSLPRYVNRHRNRSGRLVGKLLASGNGRNAVVFTRSPSVRLSGDRFS
jgi:hypothetical protein